MSFPVSCFVPVGCGDSMCKRGRGIREHPDADSSGFADAMACNPPGINTETR